MISGDDDSISANMSDSSVGTSKDKKPYPVERTVSANTDIVTDKKTEIRHNVERYAQLFGADEDAFDQPTTSRKELWSYYLYYNGDNGVGPGSYSQTL